MKVKIGFFLFLTVILIGSCKQVDLPAPEGSTLTISVSPPSVPAFGQATITVVGTRPNGAPLPDGTSIRFTLSQTPGGAVTAAQMDTLGTVTPNPAETKGGVATALYRAGGTSGTITITAISGASETASTDILVGEARPAAIILVADPPTLPPGGGSARLRAYVRDTNGDPVQGVQVFFSTTNGILASGGTPVRTDASGIARDTIETGADATITALTSNNVEDTIELEVGPRPGDEIQCDFEFSPSDPVVGEDVFFVDTSIPGDARLSRFRWNFGDGDTDSGRTVEHSYDAPGTYTVVHTVEDNLANVSTCVKTVTVVTGQPICSFEVNPPSPEVGEIVTFDASDSRDVDGELPVLFTWDFNGDGIPNETTTSPVTTFSYPGSGTFTVVLTVTDDEGNESTCTETVFVSPP